jgi:hypothetical protein
MPMAGNEQTGRHLCLIIHSHRPYSFDLNEIMALPSGFRFRNRFDAQWIDQDLKQDIEATVGGRVLLILRDVTNNKLIPFRWGRLFNVERIAKVVLFDYHLEDIIQYSNDDNVIAEEINSRTKMLAERHPWLPGEAGKGLTSPSVFKSDVGWTLPSKDADDRAAWGNCISAIATAPSYLRIEFLKIIGLFGSNGEKAPVVDDALLVNPNSVYQLRVFQYVPDPGPEDKTIPAHDLELISFPGHIVALRPKQQVVGKYDRLNFDIKVLDLAPGERTALAIPDSPDAATEHSASITLYIPLKVAETGNSRAIVAIVIAAISLFFMFRPHIGALPQEVVRNLATVIFVLTVAGPSRALSAIWPTWPWGVGK